MSSSLSSRTSVFLALSSSSSILDLIFANSDNIVRVSFSNPAYFHTSGSTTYLNCSLIFVSKVYHYNCSVIFINLCSNSANQEWRIWNFSSKNFYYSSISFFISVEDSFLSISSTFLFSNPFSFYSLASSFISCSLLIDSSFGSTTTGFSSFSFLTPTAYCI